MENNSSNGGSMIIVFVILIIVASVGAFVFLKNNDSTKKNGTKCTPKETEKVLNASTYHIKNDNCVVNTCSSGFIVDATNNSCKRDCSGYSNINVISDETLKFECFPQCYDSTDKILDESAVANINRVICGFEPASPSPGGGCSNMTLDNAGSIEKARTCKLLIKDDKCYKLSGSKVEEKIATDFTPLSADNRAEAKDCKPDIFTQDVNCYNHQVSGYPIISYDNLLPNNDLADTCYPNYCEGKTFDNIGTLKSAVVCELLTDDNKDCYKVDGGKVVVKVAGDDFGTNTKAKQCLSLPREAVCYSKEGNKHVGHTWSSQLEMIKCDDMDTGTYTQSEPVRKSRFALPSGGRIYESIGAPIGTITRIEPNQAEPTHCFRNLSSDVEAVSFDSSTGECWEVDEITGVDSSEANKHIWVSCRNKDFSPANGCEAGIVYPPGFDRFNMDPSKTKHNGAMPGKAKISYKDTNTIGGCHLMCYTDVKCGGFNVDPVNKECTLIGTTSYPVTGYTGKERFYKKPDDYYKYPAVPNNYTEKAGGVVNDGQYSGNVVRNWHKFYGEHPVPEKPNLQPCFDACYKDASCTGITIDPGIERCYKLRVSSGYINDTNKYKKTYYKKPKNTPPPPAGSPSVYVSSIYSPNKGTKINGCELKDQKGKFDYKGFSEDTVCPYGNALEPNHLLKAKNGDAVIYYIEVSNDYTLGLYDGSKWIYITGPIKLSTGAGLLEGAVPMNAFVDQNGKKMNDFKNNFAGYNVSESTAAQRAKVQGQIVAANAASESSYTTAYTYDIETIGEPDETWCVIQ